MTADTTGDPSPDSIPDPTSQSSEEPRVGRAQAAQALGVPRRRLRRLVRDGQLRAPRPGGDRAGVGASRAEIDTLADTRAGQVASVNPDDLAAAPVTLTRTLDRVVDDENTLSSGETIQQQVHVRVWDGLAPEGRRVVVVLGELPGTHIDPFTAPARIAARWLAVPAPEAVWVLFRPHDTAELARIEWLHLEWDHTHPHRPRRDGPAPAVEVRDARTRSLTFTALEALIGEPVEGYPAAAYTPETIGRFTRHGHTVDVAPDNVGLARLTRAIATLDGTAHALEHHGPSTAPHRAGDARPGDARVGAALLADEIRVRWDLRDGLAHDATSSGPRGSFDAPRRWAARIVPITHTAEHAAVLERYPEPCPVEPEQRGEWEALLARWWAWADEVGPHADRPDPELHSALETAASVLLHWLGVLDRKQHGRDAPDQPHRPSEVRTYTVRGETDQDFLDRLTPVDPIGQPGAGSVLRRRARAVADRFTNHRRWALHELCFGYDRDGHLVAVEPHPGPGYRTRDYAVEWPLGPLPDPLPGDAALVADGGPGDRPVYIRWPDHSLAPLPGRPDGQIHAGWNFGYSGSGPDALAADIGTRLAAHMNAVARDRLVRELSRGDHRSRLDLQLSDLTVDPSTDSSTGP